MGREDVILLVCGKGRGLFVLLVWLIECAVCVTVGVACGLAQIGFAAQVAAAASTVGALQQTCCAIVEHRLGTVFQ